MSNSLENKNMPAPQLSEDERNQLIAKATYQYAITELSFIANLAAQSEHNLINPKKAEKTCQEYQDQFEATLDKLGIIPKYFAAKANEILFERRPMNEVSIPDRIEKFLKIKTEYEQSQTYST